MRINGSQFGPWSTALGFAVPPQLSAFWKRRMQLLVATQRTLPVFRKSHATALLILLICLAAIPTVHHVVAQDAEAAADGKPPLNPPGTIFISATIIPSEVKDSDQRLLHGAFAVDPNSGKWEWLCDSRSDLIRATPDGSQVLHTTRKGLLGIFDVEARQDSTRLDTWREAIVVPDDSKTLIAMELPEPKRRESRPNLDVPGDSYLIVSTSFPDRWRITIEGEKVQQLPIPANYRVTDCSRDGQWLVGSTIGSVDDGQGVFVMRMDGREKRRVSLDGRLCSRARFAPDHKTIAYVHFDPQNSLKTIHLVGFGGENDRQLVDVSQRFGPALQDYVCWSPDGKWLAVAVNAAEIQDDGRYVPRRENPESHVLLVDPTGQNVHEVELADGKARVLRGVDWR